MALSKEDLQAISELLDAKLEAKLEPLHQRIATMESATLKKLDLLTESIGHVNERYAQLDKVEKTVENHGDRIFALEQAANN